MPKVNFQQVPRNNKMFRHTSNCDTLIRRIKDFYFPNEAILSLEDKIQLLEYIQTIDRANKVLDARTRNNIYVGIRNISQKYLTR